MFHRHWTVAFRALDTKWGQPVDLDTSSETLTMPCLPAVIEKSATTFSSEEYLSTIRRRPKPYSRQEAPVRRKRMKDSFSNISLARFQSSSDLGDSITSLHSEEYASTQDLSVFKAPTNAKVSDSDITSVMEELSSLIEELKQPVQVIDDAVKAEAALEKRKGEVKLLLKRLKTRTLSYVEQKYKNSL